MTERFFDNYSENTFNTLYGFLEELQNNELDWEWGKEKAERILEKLRTYFSIKINKDDEDESEEKISIQIGWFGEELRDLVYIFLMFIKTENKRNYFEELVSQKKQELNDPNFYKRIKIKHFSSNVMFLSDEKEKLLEKGRAILNTISENTSKLELDVSDFPSRMWVLVRHQKTKSTYYDFQQEKEGWKITKCIINKNNKTSEIIIYKLNNETLEYTKSESETNYYDEIKERQGVIK